jgi:hypothetical protein
MCAPSIREILSEPQKNKMRAGQKDPDLFCQLYERLSWDRACGKI